MLGRPDDAAAALDVAIPIARRLADGRRLARALDALGSVCTADPDLPATAGGGAMDGMPGMSPAGGGRDAGRYFDEAAAVAAVAAGDDALAARAAANAAVADLAAAADAKAQRDRFARDDFARRAAAANRAAHDAAGRLPATHDRAFLLTTVGHNAARLAAADPGLPVPPYAEADLRAAADVAGRLLLVVHAVMALRWAW